MEEGPSRFCVAIRNVNAMRDDAHARCPMRDARCAMPDARCPMRDARCAMPDARCPMRDARCAMPDARCAMRVARVSSLCLHDSIHITTKQLHYKHNE